MSNHKIPSRPRDVLPETAGSTDVDAFIAAARRVARPPLGEGRLILALDATMSRQPTWDLACRLQGEMFDAVGKAGHLSVQLAYFRGFGECRASQFVADAEALKRLMERIDCRGGQTQIGKVLSHSLKETRRQKVQALVFIGDAMEEAVDDLAAKAGQLGLEGTPVFLFQEGHDPVAERAFREIARLSRGAWFRFDRTAASSLADLLSAIARYASGGLAALEGSTLKGDRLLLSHLGGSAR